MPVRHFHYNTTLLFCKHKTPRHFKAEATENFDRYVKSFHFASNYKGGVALLTSITVTVTNNPYLCGIEITSTANVESVGSITSVVINRSENDGSYEVIKTIEVTDVADLTFDLLDASAKSGSQYEYSINLMAGETISEFGVSDAVQCSFCGLFVGDSTGYYIAGTNFKTETKRNILREYVTTLAGRYPYAVSNADTNYTTGTSTGLFLQLTPDKKSFLPDTYHTYSNAVVDFLCNGNPKILKTHDGQAWYVSIDASPNVVYSDFTGNNAVQFSWTEVGELPMDGSSVIEVSA